MTMDYMGSVLSTNRSREFGPATLCDALIPPLIGLMSMIIGLLMLSICTQPLWWKHLNKKKRVTSLQSGDVQAIDMYTNKRNNVFSPKDKSKINFSLIDDNDHEVLHRFNMFQNNPWALLKLAIPCLLSVGLSPITILVQPTLIDFFYPEFIGGRINTNDSLAVFLLPAGLVYAMAFGFALQDALAKFDVTMTTAKHHLTVLRHCQYLVLLSTVINKQKKLVLFRLLSKCTINWMTGEVDIKLRKPDKNIWSFVSEIQDTPTTSGVQAKIIDDLLEKVLELDSLSREGYTGATANITILQWIFMELLGFIAYFGVLLTVAESYRLELAMCVLTVFSISAFIFILGDLDYAYHGTFKVDLGCFVTFISELDDLYKRVHLEDDIVKSGTK